MILPFLSRMDQLAQAYDAAPLFDASAVEAYKALASESVALADEISRKLAISVVDDAETYENADAMFMDIRAGRFKVSRANSDHPLWTVEQNIAFRTVHDVYGHMASNGQFDWQGENLACGAHDLVLSPLARKALVTECIGQVAYALHTGAFGIQKVAFLSADVIDSRLSA